MNCSSLLMIIGACSFRALRSLPSKVLRSERPSSLCDVCLVSLLPRPRLWPRDERGGDLLWFPLRCDM